MLSEIVTQFSPADLAGQFLLSREAPNVGWPVDSIAGWHLAVDARLPHVRLLQDGRTVRLTEEPDASRLQRLAVNLLKLVPGLERLL